MLGQLLKPIEVVNAQLNFSDRHGLYNITNVGSLITAVVGLMLILAALLAFFFLILGGIQWITSGGEKSAMEAARNKITHAIVGLVIVGAAWAIMLLVQNFLGIQIIGSSNFQLPSPIQ
jgi:hypothetical protein